MDTKGERDRDDFQQTVHVVLLQNVRRHYRFFLTNRHFILSNIDNELVSIIYVRASFHWLEICMKEIVIDLPVDDSFNSPFAPAPRGDGGTICGRTIITRCERKLETPEDIKLIT